jgi:hypothetical protein
VAVVAGRDKLKRLGWFLYIFAVWDIFYYIFLKILIGWPESFMTWDILFLIPVTWVGPVLAPLICSVTMIGMACVLILPGFWGLRVKAAAAHWALIFSGAAVIFVSFVKDYSLIIIRGGYLGNYFELHRNTGFMKEVTSFIPQSFSWPLFWVGEALILIALFLMARKTAVRADIIRQR